MAEQWTRVECQMTECIYYHPDPKTTKTILCEHKDKLHYMDVLPCPLYRMDWKRKAAMAQNMARMMKR